MSDETGCNPYSGKRIQVTFFLTSLFWYSVTPRYRKCIFLNPDSFSILSPANRERSVMGTNGWGTGRQGCLLWRWMRDHVGLTGWQKTCIVSRRKVFDVFPSFCKPMLKKLGTMLFILVIRKIIHLGVICISCYMVLSLIPAAWVGGTDPKGLWRWKKKLTIVTICL